MGDISNKTLAILVGVAIVISIAGLFIGTRQVVTGMATTADSSGTAYANLTANVDINLSDTAINFGQVQPEWIVNSDNTTCDDGNGNNIACEAAGACNSPTHGTNCSNISDVMTFQSTGKTKIKVEFYANDSLFNVAIGDVSKRCNGNLQTTNCNSNTNHNESDASFQFQTQGLTVGGTSAGCLYDAYEKTPTGFTNIPVNETSKVLIAEEFAYLDAANITMKIDVPKFEEFGAKNATIIVYATQDGDAVPGIGC